MVSERALHQATDRLTAYINRYVTLAGAESKEEVLVLFDNIQKVFPNWVIMTCPVMSSDMEFVSSNYQHVFGHSKELVTINNHIESLFYHVHDNDQQDLHNCFNYIHDALEEVPPELHCQYRAIYHYRFRKPTGEHIYIHDEKAVLNLRGAGNSYYGLFKDITGEKAFSGVKVELFRQLETSVKIAEFKPSTERSSLTKREVEIVDLIKQGLSTKEIAWHLNISHNTVRNIKSRMFEKYNVSNTIELLNMTA